MTHVSTKISIFFLAIATLSGCEWNRTDSLVAVNRQIQMSIRPLQNLEKMVNSPYSISNHKGSVWICYPDPSGIVTYNVYTDSINVDRLPFPTYPTISFDYYNQENFALLRDSSICGRMNGLPFEINLNIGTMSDVFPVLYGDICLFPKRESVVIQVVNYANEDKRKYIMQTEYLMEYKLDGTYNLLNIVYPEIYGDGRKTSVFNYLSSWENNLLISNNISDDCFIYSLDNDNQVITLKLRSPDSRLYELPVANGEEKSLILQNKMNNDIYFEQYGKLFRSNDSYYRLYYPRIPEKSDRDNHYYTIGNKPIQLLKLSKSGELEQSTLPSNYFFNPHNFWMYHDTLMYLKYINENEVPYVFTSVYMYDF